MNKVIYAFKINSSYLVGMEQDGIPCSNCVGLWLTARNVSHERTQDFKPQQDILDAISVHPAIIYEVDAETGASTRIECRLEKHSECDCKAVGYIDAPGARRLNFAFCSMLKLQCSRFSTPTGNIWVSRGTFVGGREVVSVATEREESRLLAANDTGIPTKLEEFANRVVSKFQTANKPPMLIVGASNYLRQRVPFFLLQQYDLHLMFYPNAGPAWVIGVVATSRISDKVEAVWSHAADLCPDEAIKKATLGLLKQIGAEHTPAKECRPKLNVWLQLWIYRCPKISLRDILALEKYEQKQFDTYDLNEYPKLQGIQRIFRVVEGGKKSIELDKPKSIAQLTVYVGSGGGDAA